MALLILMSLDQVSSNLYPSPILERIDCVHKQNLLLRAVKISAAHLRFAFSSNLSALLDHLEQGHVMNDEALNYLARITSEYSVHTHLLNQNISYSPELAEAISSKKLTCDSVESCSANAKFLLKEAESEFQQKLDEIKEELKSLIKTDNDYNSAYIQCLSDEKHPCPFLDDWKPIKENMNFLVLEAEELKRKMRIDW